MRVLGIDPGARGSGIVLVDTATREVLDARTIRRPDEPLVQVSPGHLAAIVDAIFTTCASNGDPAKRPDLIAVEGVVEPSPHANRANGRATTNVGAILATSIVLGTVLAAASSALCPPLVVIRPGRNGSQALGTYPPELVAPGERRDSKTPSGGRIPWQVRPAGKGALKDQRSAFDVAMQAPITYRALEFHHQHETPPTPYTWKA